MKRAERAAVGPLWRALRQELGTLRAARVIGAVLRGKMRSEPFAALGPPQDECDELSRKQCGDAVLIYRTVARLADDETALRVVRAAIVAGGVRFLDEMIPPLPSSDLGAFAREIASRFFNAESETGAAEDDQSFEMTVTRCRFVELLAAVDASKLAPLFCEVDSVYFGGGERPIKLGRTKTLATGGDCCDFRFERA